VDVLFVIIRSRVGAEPELPVPLDINIHENNGNQEEQNKRDLTKKKNIYREA
jgi:hypothetical protein